METDDIALEGLFGYDKLERELILSQNNFSPPPPLLSALNDYRDEMTREEAYSYSEQVLKTDGFDVFLTSMASIVSTKFNRAT
ncbi:hypothetical protein I3760_10G104500 [Carya illinoinensis]|nr:hypothetical protein I3760_10G104500 [Carya illinoinensis]